MRHRMLAQPALLATEDPAKGGGEKEREREGGRERDAERQEDRTQERQKEDKRVGEREGWSRTTSQDGETEIREDGIVKVPFAKQ